MKKYLEQRVEQLELEINLLKAKFKLEETKSKSTSSYLNNYPKYDPFKDYMHNSSENFMSPSPLETSIASPFDNSVPDNFLDTFSFKNPVHSDADIENGSSKQHYVSYDEYPEYPNIWGSFDANPEDVITEDQTTFAPWGFVSEFDKMDKNFLDWIKIEGKRLYEKSLYKKTKNK